MAGPGVFKNRPPQVEKKPQNPGCGFKLRTGMPDGDRAYPLRDASKMLSIVLARVALNASSL